MVGRVLGDEEVTQLRGVESAREIAVGAGGVLVVGGGEEGVVVLDVATSTTAL